MKAQTTPNRPHHRPTRRPAGGRSAIPVSAVLLACLPCTLQAEPVRVQPAIDGGILGVSLLGAALLGTFGVRDRTPWGETLLPLDENVKGFFAPKAAQLSDALLLFSAATPLVLQLGRFGLNRDFARTSLVYGEALGVTVLLTAATKHLVQRPRPYVYHPDPAVQAYAADQGDDAYLSFFSGHAAFSFASAVAGAYLFGLSSPDPNASALVWGLEMAMATATAHLRVRAGKHFYTDVLVGAVVGSGVSALVVQLHRKEGPGPDARAWAAMAAGIAVGTLASAWWPLESEPPHASSLSAPPREEPRSGGPTLGIGLFGPGLMVFGHF